MASSLSKRFALRSFENIYSNRFTANGFPEGMCVACMTFPYAPFPSFFVKRKRFSGSLKSSFKASNPTLNKPPEFLFSADLVS